MIHSLAIACSLGLLIYHQLTTWFPLYPWNDVAKYQRSELWLEAGINAITMGLVPVCLLSPNVGFFHAYPFYFFPLLIAGEFFSWWKPYFFGAAPAYEAKLRSYFERTTKLIPQHPTHVTPDANHIVLHGLTLVTATLAFWDRLTLT